MNAPAIDQATEAWSEEMTRQAIENAKRSYGEERYNRILEDNPNLIAEYRAKHKANAMQTIEGILNRTEDQCKRVSWGAFHPSNKFSRKLFTAATGLELPSTVGGTDKVIRQWFGDAMVAYENARNAEIDAEKAKQQRERQEREIKRKAAVSKEWLEGREIGGCDLLELARDLGIEVHPRTAGSIRKRLAWVKLEGSAGAYGGHLPDGVWSVINEVRQRYNKETTAA